MKQLVLVLAILAACGGSSKPATTAEPVKDPVPMTDPVAEPAKPEEPATPEEPKPDPKAELLAAETAAFEKAKPVFEKHCRKCHATGSRSVSEKKLAAFDMGTYPFGGRHGMGVSGAIRKVLAIGGGKATMPADAKGAVKGEELALIATWADAFDASHAGGAHEGMEGHKH
jgi:hypothetical protein